MNLSAVALGMLILAGLAYILIRRAQFSIWWVAFFSSAIYGMPVFFGVDVFGRTISPKAELIVLLVQGALLAICIFRRNSVAVIDRMDAGNLVPLVANIVCVVALVAVVAMYGTSIFAVHKTESGIAAHAYILWRVSATFAIVAAMLARRYGFAIFPLLSLVATVFAGDRTALGLSVVALTWMIFERNLVSRKWMLVGGVAVVAVGMGILFGKTFQAQWATGDFVSPAQTVSIIVQGGQASVVRTEPFAVMAVHSALVDYRGSPPGYLAVDLLGQLLIVPSVFGFESASFNDFFQPILFPEFRERSLAYSYWGEAFSRAGWAGVLGFFCVYTIGLFVFERLTRASSALVATLAYVGGSYWAFYIHRNSMVSIVAYERQIVVFAVLLFAVVFIVRAFHKRVRT